MNKSRQQRREEAANRQEERKNRSPEQQIQHLDRILGKGQGATKERAGLAKMMEKK